MSIIIKNAMIPDPVSMDFKKGGLTIVNGRIADTYEGVQDIELSNFSRVVDAEGLFLMPGFFDIHSRSDLFFITSPLRKPAISQGILMEIIGQDGTGVAPVSSKNYESHYRYTFDSLSNKDLQWTWQSVFEYLDTINKRTTVNTTYYVPYGTLRLESSLSTKLSVDGEYSLLSSFQRAMDEGASGLSISTHLSPSVLGWLDKNEIVPLLKMMSTKGGILSVNVHGSRDVSKDVLKSLELAQSNNVKLHISRLNVKKKDDLTKVLGLMDRLSKDVPGFIVDTSPFTGSLIRLSELIPLGHSSDSEEIIMNKLKRPDLLRRAFEDRGIKEQTLDSFKLALTSIDEMKKYEGLGLGDISLHENRSIYDVLFKLLTMDVENTIFEYRRTEESLLSELFSRDYVLPATTGCVYGKHTVDNFCTIPEYFKNFAKKGLYELFQKLCYKPAEFYKTRWGVKKGILANIILIDPKKLNCDFSYSLSDKLAAGVELAVVNGRIVMQNGIFTGNCPGMVTTWN